MKKKEKIVAYFLGSFSTIENWIVKYNLRGKKPYEKPPFSFKVRCFLSSLKKGIKYPHNKNKNLIF